MESYRNKDTGMVVEVYQTDKRIDLTTADGESSTAFPGDYIATGVYGEQYIYTAEVFKNDFVKEVADE